MSKKRKRYLVTADGSEALACSLVTDPAMEELYVAFNNQEELVEKFADEKKHMICGVVCIPQKPIYRRDADGNEYDIVFSEEAVEKMCRDYLREYRQNEVTLQHQEETNGVYLVEQWIKNDMVYDKSIAMGLSKDIPVGSWFQTYYVDSNEVWNRIQNGELRGFSLECMLNLDEIEFNKINEEVNMEDMTFWTKMKELLQEFFKKEEQFEETPVETPAETTVEVAETTEQPTTETVEVTTTPEETTTEEVETVEETKEPEHPTTETKESEDNVQLNELVKNLMSEIEALKNYNMTLKEKLDDMGKQPSTKPVNVSAGGPSNGDTYSAWREQMEKLL